MILKITFYSFIIFVSLFLNACSNKSMFHAPNGKIYYLDLDNCSTHTIIRDTLICHDEKDIAYEKQYRPVSFGYSIDTRPSF